MKVVVLASQKGGAGKTTLTAHLAVEAARRGSRVVVVDLDPQMGLMEWWNARAADTPVAAQFAAADLAAGIASLRESFDFMFIDTPPALGDNIRLAMAHADLVVIPVQPSPNDLRAVGATIRMAREVRKRLLFVRNRSNPRHVLARETARLLAAHGPSAHGDIGDRTDFKAAMAEGLTASEINPWSRSAVEVAALWDVVAEQLGGV
jgi:chromosome partitioning protein